MTFCRAQSVTNKAWLSMTVQVKLQMQAFEQYYTQAPMQAQSQPQENKKYCFVLLPDLDLLFVVVVVFFCSHLCYACN